MTKVTFICPDGETETVDVPAGTSIMKAAVAHGIDSIIGDCGGSASCATCHVYLEEGAHMMPLRSALEDEMLHDAASEVLPNSRLGCQLVMRDDVASLIVRVAPEQW